MQVRHRRTGRLVALGGVCLAALAMTGLASGGLDGRRAATPTSTTARARVTGGSVSLTNSTWGCSSPVNLDSVSVTMTTGNKVAIVLTKGCTGTIRSITVNTDAADGIHVNDGAHDLTIGGGSITCTGHAPGVHQDGIQAMSGSNVTFSNLTINCPTASNSGLYVNWSGDKNVTPPSNILCNACRLYGTQSSTAFIGAHSTQSGLQNSTLCKSRYFTYRKYSTTAVDSGNSYPKSC